MGQRKKAQLGVFVFINFSDSLTVTGEVTEMIFSFVS